MHGDDILAAEIDGHYEHYGKAQLRQICEHHGWDADQWDDDVRVNNEVEL